MNYLKENYEILKKRFPHIANEISKYRPDSNGLVVESAQNGLLTCCIERDARFYIHSKYDPEQEAKRFADMNVEDNSDYDIILLYGFGLGYTVRSILQKLAGTTKLVVFESNFNILYQAMVHIDLSDIMVYSNLEIVAYNDRNKFLYELKRYSYMDGKSKLILHLPSIKAIQPENDDIKLLLESWNLTNKSYKSNKENIESNYESNTNNIHTNVDVLFDNFRNIPVLVIGAGPSLDSAIEFIKQAKSKMLIFSCGTAVKALLHNGITPDMFMITDPTISTYEQIKGIENIGIPAVFLSTACSYTVDMYKGDKLIAFQREYSSNSGMTPDATIGTGGSVVTSMLDLCLKLGCNPIGFIGEDLAYINKKHHASDTEHGEENKFDALNQTRTVKNSKGEVLQTTLGFLSQKKWIENKIKDSSNILFYNCTNEGALIEGTIEIDLESFISKYSCEKNDYTKQIIDIIK